jgi:hypothetical protein
MLRVFWNAPFFESIALCQQLGPLKGMTRRALVHQLFKSESVGFAADGQFLAAAGFYPLESPDDEERFEGWFFCVPELKAHLPAFIKLARLTHKRMAQYGPVCIRYRVKDSWKPGHKLARLCHLTRAGFEDGFVIYEWRSHVQVDKKYNGLAKQTESCGG